MQINSRRGIFVGKVKIEIKVEKFPWRVERGKRIEF
jgi:hypothetical protein